MPPAPSRTSPRPQLVRRVVVVGTLAGVALVLPWSSPASASTDTTPPPAEISIQTLGTASGGDVSTEPIASITVPDVDPDPGKVLFLWVLHRRGSADTPPQEITGIAHSEDLKFSSWTKEFHSWEPNLQRFALFRAATGETDPPSSDLTVSFSSPSHRTLVIVLEATGVDPVKPLTNLVTDEAFGNNPTQKTHYLQGFSDPVYDAGLAFQMAGGDTEITPEAGLQRVAHASNGPKLTTAAAFDPPGGAVDLDPTFTWTDNFSSGGLALELRAERAAPEFPIQRKHLTEGTAGGGSSAGTASIQASPGKLLVAFVANWRGKGTPALPSLSGPGGISWSRAGTATFDTVASPLKRLTVLVAKGEDAFGPVSISFPTANDSISWIVFELTGADLVEPVRQTAVGTGNGIATAQASFLRSFGAPNNATLAAVALDAAGEPAVEPGWARAFRIGTGSTSVKDLQLWGEWRSTPDTSPTATLASSADAAIVAVEIKQDGVPQIPAVTEVTPRRGPDAGGTEVVITGSDFTDGGTPEVRFGNEPATLLESASSRLRVRSPAHVPANVAVTVKSGELVSENTPQDDFRFLPRISVDDPSPVSEAAPSVSFPVGLSAAAPWPVTVAYATTDGTARAGSDYEPTSGTLTIPAGQTTVQIPVPVVGDTIDELNEKFAVNLSSASNATIHDGRGIGRIDDDDPAPSMTIDDVRVLEGNAGTRPATFTVSLSSPSGKPVTVAVATSNGTASAGEDYVALSGQKLEFAPGETSRTIDVTVNGDVRDEPHETFSVNLSSAQNASIADGQGQGTVEDDDEAPAPTTPELSIGDVSVTEGAGGTKVGAAFAVKLSTKTTSDVTFVYTTVDDTATAASGDYTAASGTGKIVAGSTSTTVRVVVRGDDVDEPNETFFVDLGSPSGATIADGRGQGTIVDDDEAPSPKTPELSIGDVSVTEGSAGTKVAAQFTVTLSSKTTSDVTFAYTTVDDTATAASGDYTAASGTGTIVAGSSSTTIRVVVRGDSIDEPNETFFVDLSNSSGATIADGRGVGTIVDDD